MDTPFQFDLIDYLAALDADDSTQSHLEDLHAEEQE
jgi:hypothetical protein